MRYQTSDLVPDGVLVTYCDGCAQYFDTPVCEHVELLTAPIPLHSAAYAQMIAGKPILAKCECHDCTQARAQGKG